MLADLLFPKASREDVQERLLARAERLEIIVGAKKDRWGREPVLAYDANGRLLQEIAVEQGLAYFWPRLLSNNLSSRMLNLEALARAKQLGVWRNTKIIHWRDKKLAGLAGEWVVLKGRVVSIGKTRSTIYLNFGGNWSEDLTATFKKSVMKEFEDAFGSLDALKGKNVEVRGVLQFKGGPWLQLAHPSELRVLPAVLKD